jgi:branched-chain amino acid transport system substrate-binding protein
MKQMLQWFGLLFISLWLPLSLIAADGLTDTEIHIGSWGPQTGPAAPWGSVPRATGSYFDMINAEGGIHGRKIVYHHFDDGYNPAKTIGGVKQLQESSHGIFAWVVGVGTASGMAVKDYIMDRKVPWIGPATGSRVWTNPPNKYLFATYPYYFNEAQVLVKHAVNSLKKKRIAMVYMNDEYGKDGLRGAEKALGELGMEMAIAIPHNFTDKDFKPVILKLRKAKADVVLLWLDPSSVVRTIVAGKQLRFDTQWMSTSTCSDFPMLYGISRGTIEGLITGSFGFTAESQNPLLLKYKRDAFDKFAPGERWGIFWYAGIGFMEPIVEGLKRAGRDLTRDKLVEAMEGINDFQGIFGKISYKPFDINDPTSRQGQHSVFLIQCLKDGKTKILTDWLTAQ